MSTATARGLVTGSRARSTGRTPEGLQRAVVQRDRELFAYPGFTRRHQRGCRRTSTARLRRRDHRGRPRRGYGGHLKVFRGGNFTELLSIFAYVISWAGVTVAAGDLDGDGFAEVITGAASVAPHVKVFDGATLQRAAIPGLPRCARSACVAVEDGKS